MKKAKNPFLQYILGYGRSTVDFQIFIFKSVNFSHHEDHFKKKFHSIPITVVWVFFLVVTYIQTCLKQNFPMPHIITSLVAKPPFMLKGDFCSRRSYDLSLFVVRSSWSFYVFIYHSIRLDEFYNFPSYAKMLRPTFNHENGHKRSFWVTVGLQ
jgi:hypothetical protein